MNGQVIKAAWSDWSSDKEAEVTQWNQALELIETVATSTPIPTILEFFDPESRRAIGIGLGRDLSVVTYQESLDPPYYISLSDREGQCVWSCYGSESSEYLPRNLINKNSAIESVRLFFESSSIPKNIAWERL